MYINRHISLFFIQTQIDRKVNKFQLIVINYLSIFLGLSMYVHTYIYTHIHVRRYNNPRKRMVQMMLSTYFPGSNFRLFCEGCYIYQTAVSPPCHVPRCSPAVPWHPAPLVPRHWPCLRPPRVRRPRRPQPWRRRLRPCRGAYAPSPEVKLEIWRVKLWKLMNTENSCDTIINWVLSGFQGWNASKVGIGTQLCLGPHFSHPFCSESTTASKHSRATG